MKYISFLILIFLTLSCQKNTDKLITKNTLGKLNNTTKIYEIDALLDSDSVVKVGAKNAYGQLLASTIKIVNVYDTSGVQTLGIKPNGALDSISLIKNIRILSDKYKTKNNITLGSTFADVKKYHKIGNVESSPRSVYVNLNDINALISFDRNVLPSNVRFDMDAEIKKTMIPDDAEINRFWINFKAEKNAEK